MPQRRDGFKPPMNAATSAGILLLVIYGGLLPAPLPAATGEEPGPPPEESPRFRGEEDRPRHIPDAYFGGRIGYLEVEEVDEGALNIGAMGGLYVLQQLGLSAAFEGHSASYDLEDRQTLALTLSGELHLVPIWSPFQLYGVGGVGYYLSKVASTDDYGNHVWRDEQGELGFHAGVGIEVDISRRHENRTSFNVELRRIFSDPERNSDAVDPDGTQLTIGLKTKIDR